MAERTVIKVDRRCCPHCDRSVSLKTYKAHRRLYYDATTGNELMMAEVLAQTVLVTVVIVSSLLRLDR